MEKSNNQACTFMPHFCNAGLEAPKPVIKLENKISQKTQALTEAGDQKPWSIFGDVYWI